MFIFLEDIEENRMGCF